MGDKRKRTENEERRLRYCKNFDSAGSSINLLEIPSEETLTKLEGALAGDCVRIVGDAGGVAVLVTNTETYSMTRVETSNTVLLMQPPGSQVAEGGGAGADEIAATASYVLRLEIMYPKYGALRALLLEEPHTGEEVGGFTFSELLGRVCMSPEELKKGIEHLKPIEVGGRFAFLDPSLQESVIDSIVGRIIETDSSMEDVEVEPMVTNLKEIGHDPCFVRYCLLLLSEKGSVSDAHLDLSMERLTILRAHQLFRQRENNFSNGGLWRKDDFDKTLAASMPGVAEPDVKILRGIGISEMVTMEGEEVECYRYLPGDALPMDPRGRLEILFGVKPKWTVDELSPYLEPLTDPSLKLADILLKHTRASTDPKTKARVHSAGWV